MDHAHGRLAVLSRHLAKEADCSSLHLTHQVDVAATNVHCCFAGPAFCTLTKSICRLAPLSRQSCMHVQRGRTQPTGEWVQSR